MGAALVATIPLVLAAWGQKRELAWVPPESPARVLSAVTRIAGGVGFGVVVAAALAALLANEAGPVRLSRPTAFLLACSVLPAAALVVSGLVVPDLVPRYALVSAPALVSVVAIAAGAAKLPAGRVLAVGGVAAAVTTTVIQQAQPYKYEDYRGAADAVYDRSRHGDVVIFYPSAVRVGFDAYPPTDADDHRVRDIALAPGGAPVLTTQIAGLDRSAQSVAQALRGAPAVFILSTRADDALWRTATGPRRGASRHRPPSPSRTLRRFVSHNPSTTLGTTGRPGSASHRAGSTTVIGNDSWHLVSVTASASKHVDARADEAAKHQNQAQDQYGAERILRARRTRGRTGKYGADSVTAGRTYCQGCTDRYFVPVAARGYVDEDAAALWGCWVCLARWSKNTGNWMPVRITVPVTEIEGSVPGR